MVPLMKRLNRSNRPYTIVLLALCIAACRQDGDGRHLSTAQGVIVSEPLVDIGTVRSWEPIEVGFTVTNQTSEPVVLEKLKTSCGCSSLAVPSYAIPAGETHGVTLSVDLRRKRGGFTERAVIGWDDRPENRIILEVKGVVRDPIEIAPPLLIVQASEEQVPGATGAALINWEQSDIEDSLNVAFSDPWLSADLTTHQLGLAELIVHVTESLPPGAYASHAFVSSNHLPNVTLPIHVDVRGIFTVTPERLFVGELKGGVAVVAYATLESHAGDSPTIESVLLPDFVKDLEAVRTARPNALNLHFTVIAPPDVKRFVKGDVVLSVSAGVVRQVTVPVGMWVR